MSPDPILLIGGSGMVGRHAAKYLRAAAPELPLLIGGRDLPKARKVAQEIGGAGAVALDLTAPDLGSTVVLGTEWLVGATSLPTLALARRFSRLEGIRLGLLLDDEDKGGPAQVSDLKGLTNAPPAALTRRSGVYVWRTGMDARTSFRAADGVPMDAIAISPNDILALAAATDAPNVEINLATGVSSSRRRGDPMSTEIVIELHGRDDAGHPLSTRRAVIHPQGQFPLTGLGVAMVLERCLGLDGQAPAPAGLYFPSQVLQADSYRTRLEEIGGRVLALETS